MRRLLAIAFLAALPAAAQIHGVPPSVTSITPSNSIPGVPASVTSLGPNGFQNPNPFILGTRLGTPGFQQGTGFQQGFGSGQRHFHRGFQQHRRHRGTVVVPYYYYPYYPVYADTYSEPASAEERAAEEEPAPSTYERRERTAYASADDDRYGEHYTDYREEERRAREEVRAAEERRAAQQREEQAQAERAKADEPQAAPEPAVVLVYKDGHRQDVSSYAITGDVLYDLAAGGARKILLADLDLPATRKLNDELGNDFRLPVRQKN